jgi:hypothetical protein
LAWAADGFKEMHGVAATHPAALALSIPAETTIVTEAEDCAALQRIRPTVYPWLVNLDDIEDEVVSQTYR